MKLIALGAGDRFHTLLQRKFFDSYELVAIMDNSYVRQGELVECCGKEYIVESPSDIGKYDYDGVLITVESYEAKRAIKRQLLEMGVLSSKIMLLRNQRVIAWDNLLSDKVAELPAGEKVYVDVSVVAEYDLCTGIQRVVNNLFRSMRNQGEVQVVPFQWMESLMTGRGYEAYISESEIDGCEYKLQPVAGEKALLLDIGYVLGKELLPTLKMAGMKLYMVVYDINPLHFPDMWNKGVSDTFGAWLAMAVAEADSIMCISKVVADDVIKYYRANRFKRKNPLMVYHFHLGFDIPKDSFSYEVRQEIKDIVLDGSTFLLVGTVSPHKNYALALRALRNICDSGMAEDIRFLIIGRDGWMNDDVKLLLKDETISQHVLWIKDASDTELRWAYQNTLALLYPSMIEGYGLPLAEAAHFNLPVLCSDIPVFHEILGEHAVYFKVNDETALQDAILDFLAQEAHPSSDKARLYTWDESAREVMDILMDRVKPYCVLF